ncbi:hypothetical protein LXA43DRAFT_1082224 [Ganoderma leucocontextum]|nr:hypothetical protein LXA43DRAFT_1082224 [Ganoderma leucocontextum]
MAPIRSEPNHNNSVSCIKKTVSQNGVTVTRYFCPLCNGSVGRKSDFLRHMERHTGGRLHYCTEPGCEHPWGFPQLGNLKAHIRAVHERKRYRCTQLCVGANGKTITCDKTYSDQSGLIRHRNRNHVSQPGDDKGKVNERTRKRRADDDDLANLPTHPSKRPKPTHSVLGPEQRVDWSSPHTLPDVQPSELGPVMVPVWDLGSGCPPNGQLHMQSQPAAGTSITDPPSLPSYITPPVQPGNLEALFNAEPPTAVVNNWTFGPQMADFDFTFTAASLPPLVPAWVGRMDPSMLMSPAPTVLPELEQANMANAGLASSPKFYGPGQGTGRGGHPSPGSSCESTVSLLGKFASMPLQWVPPPNDPLFNGYYSL